METVLQTYDLTKFFGKKAAVDHVNMTIPKGEIYGFIGRNGAGKTTLMRMILSLALPTEGRFELFGEAPSPVHSRRIGSLVETPGLYNNCSAKENLARFAVLYGQEVQETERILDIIGLSGTGSKKVKQFSLGMKQRLGIGIALLANPEFIVLDEPVNGLDPAGIMEVRNLIQYLNREEGITFLISSHLLDELGKIATRFGIINNGRLVEEITMAQLNTRSGSTIRYVVDNPEKGEAVLTSLLGAERINRQDFALLVQAPMSESAALNRRLVEAGVEVSAISREAVGLEEFFMERMGR